MAVRLPSPNQFELSYRNFEEKCACYLATRIPAVGMIVAVAAVAIFSGVVDRMLASKFHFDMNGGFMLVIFARHRFAIAAMLSLIFLVVTRRIRSMLLVAAMLFIWGFAVSTRLRGPYYSTDNFLLFLLIPFLCLLGWLFLRHCRRGGAYGRAAVVFSLTFWGLVAGMLFLVKADQNENLVKFLLHLGPQYYWASFLIFAYEKNPIDGLSFAFNPVHAIRGVLWTYDLRQPDDSAAKKKALWWHGMQNLLLGYLLVILRMQIEFRMASLTPHAHNLASFFVAHFDFMLGDVAFFNLLIGSARIFGYQVRDATNFAILSRTPADYWRRVSVYNYIAILHYVYIPIYKRLKNRFLSAFVAYGAYFMNRFGLRNVVGVIGFSTGLAFFKVASKAEISLQLMLFLAWFSLIYLTNRWWFFTHAQREKPLWGWLSILATHFVFSFSTFGVIMAHAALTKAGVF